MISDHKAKYILENLIKENRILFNSLIHSANSYEIYTHEWPADFNSNNGIQTGIGAGKLSGNKGTYLPTSHLCAK